MAQAGRSTFGKYVLLRKLASGGMGEIFLAKQRGPSGFEKLLVIKRILSHHLDKRDYLDMFFSEAKLVARLNHNNIIQIHEMGEIDGDYYIAMEYVRGKSLRDLIDELRAEGRVLPLPHAIDLAIKLCEGLGYAHQARDIRGRPMNIVHRDINPHNILVSYGGDLKLIDFGIAKSEMTSVHTATGTIKGKFVYMSPEQSAADPIDRRSDIFSLGIVIYEMTCLENPFVRQNVVLSLEAIQRQPVPLPSSKRSDASALDHILAKALEKRPEDRYQTAIEMRDDLRALFRSGSVTPASEDVATFLHELFAADISEEDRLLAEADQATAEGDDVVAVLPPVQALPPLTPPSDLAPTESPFLDEEPTLAEDESLIAAKSMEVSLRDRFPSDEENAYAPPAAPSSAMTEGGASAFASEIPTRSDRVPRPKTTRPPTPGNGHSVDYLPSAAFAEPLPASAGLLGPGSGPGIDYARGMVPAAFSGPSSPAFIGTPNQATDEDHGVLAPRSALWSRVGRVVAYLAVLAVTTIAGFQVTRAVIASQPTAEELAIEPVDHEIREPTPAPDPEFVGDKTSVPELSAGTSNLLVEPSSPAQPKAVAVVAKEKPATRNGSSNNHNRTTNPGAPAKENTNIKGNTGVKDNTGVKALTAPVPAKKEPAAAKKGVGAADVDSTKQGSAAKEGAHRQAGAGAGAGAGTRTEEPIEALTRDENQPPRLGTLTLDVSSRVQASLDGASVEAPASLTIRRESGRVTLKDALGADTSVTLEYRVLDAGVAIKIAATPWAVVKHNGLALGKSPQGPVGAARQHQFTLLRPGLEAPLDLSISWNPAKR